MDVALKIRYNENDLIAACVKNERWAQQRLYEDHYQSLMPICLRYARNESEAMDILHEGFIKIFKSIAKYQPGTSLSAWMGRITVNTAIDYYRKMVRRRTEDIDHAYHVKSSSPDVVSLLAAKDILSCVTELSTAYRVVFNMYVMEGFSHKEIAKQLNITESTSRSNLVKARAKLRVLLNERKERG